MKAENITFDPSENKVLGVFGNDIYIRSLFTGNNLDDVKTIVLIISREEYSRVWNLWLDGKKEYCERHNHFCGVDGVFYAKEFEVADKVLINMEAPFWDFHDEDTWTYIETPVDTFRITKFNDAPDFEHG